MLGLEAADEQDLTEGGRMVMARRRSKKGSGLTENQLLHLLTGDCFDSMEGRDLGFPFRSDDHRRQLWRENRHRLIDKDVGDDDGLVKRETRNTAGGLVVLRCPGTPADNQKRRILAAAAGGRRRLAALRRDASDHAPGGRLERCRLSLTGV